MQCLAQHKCKITDFDLKNLLMTYTEKLSMNNVDYLISCNSDWHTESAHWWELSLIYTKNMGLWLSWLSIILSIGRKVKICPRILQWIRCNSWPHRVDRAAGETCKLIQRQTLNQRYMWGVIGEMEDYPSLTCEVRQNIFWEEVASRLNSKGWSEVNQVLKGAWGYLMEVWDVNVWSAPQWQEFARCWK